MSKTFICDFKLPQLSASHYWYSVEVVANNIGRALDLAFKDVRKRPAVKGKRLKEATVSIREVTSGED